MKRAWQYSRIGRQYHFSAAHMLPKVPKNHPCNRLHGHNYMVEVEVRGDIHNKYGFCNGVDFAMLDAHIDPIIARLDHQYLNDIEGLENPTAEIIAQWIMDQMKVQFVFSVKVWETPRCWAMAVNADGVYQSAHKE